ncbi:MAG TPA: anthranilate synthase component I family protein [Azospirillaceae bacterium]|nr:anthranilate synthase component I family protein [Azospirillaceae bacterium]
MPNHPARAAPSIPVAVRTRDIPRVDPFAAYLALRAARGAHDVVLLESLAGPQHDTAQSMVFFGQLAALEVSGKRIRFSGKPPLVDAMRKAALDAGVAVLDGHRLALPDEKGLLPFVRALQAAFDLRDADGRPARGFGFFGYFGYDLVRAIEELPRTIQAGTDLPDVHLALYRGAVRIDHASGTTQLVETQGPYWGPVEAAIPEGLPGAGQAPVPAAPTPVEVMDTMTRAQFEERVAAAMEHILDGDTYQVQIGHEILIRSSIQPLDVYRRLRHRNPAPYMYLATLGRATLVGASPEVLFRLDGDRIVMRPLAGTIPRGPTPEEDAANVHTLRNDPKEIAEHIMLVDLCRNDLGRICVPGSLEVTDLLAVERYSHVHHLVSNVVARLAPGTDTYDAIRATFPAGTMSGAPKVRSMEIIEALELTRRGPYAGCVGFIDFGGDAVLALCIRTAVHTEHGYSIRASAGIVADSVPEKEWRETIVKMGATYWAIVGEELKP